MIIVTINSIVSDTTFNKIKVGNIILPQFAKNKSLVALKSSFLSFPTRAQSVVLRLTVCESVQLSCPPQKSKPPQTVSPPLGCFASNFSPVSIFHLDINPRPFRLTTPNSSILPLLDAVYLIHLPVVRKIHLGPSTCT